MVDSKNITISPIVNSALSNFKLAVKRLPNNLSNKHKGKEENDEFTTSGSEPRPTSERLKAAVTKFNGGNELRIVAVTNYCAEPDNDCNLLQLYMAYKNPELKDSELTLLSDDTVTATYKRKQVTIQRNVTDNGSKKYEINFEDGSKIKYVSFTDGGSMEINGEEFEMPAGTIYEEKSVHGKVFSQLIRTPDMRRNVINMPEILDKAEQIFESRNPSEQA